MKQAHDSGPRGSRLGPSDGSTSSNAITPPWLPSPFGEITKPSHVERSCRVIEAQQRLIESLDATNAALVQRLHLDAEDAAQTVERLQFTMEARVAQLRAAVDALEVLSPSIYGEDEELLLVSSAGIYLDGSADDPPPFEWTTPDDASNFGAYPPDMPLADLLHPHLARLQESFLAVHALRANYAEGGSDGQSISVSDATAIDEYD